MSALELARGFAARGWRPFPVEYGGKRPAVGIKWGTAAAVEPTDGMFELWFGRAPVNVGIAAKGSGLVVLDEDVDGGMTSLCEAYGQPVPQTYRVRTAKGWHWYFLAPAGAIIGNAAGPLADFGFDVRGGKGDGGYVVAAGSLHESGHVYEAEDPAADTAELPEWIGLLLTAPEVGTESVPADAEHAESGLGRRYTMDQAAAWVTRYAIEPLKAATPGGRNIALNTAAIVVGHFLPAFWTREWATGRLTELAHELQLDESEILPTIRSGMRAGMADPYTLVESPDPFEAASSGEAAAEAEYEHEVAVELHRLKVRDEARRRLAVEGRQPLVKLSASQFLAAAALEYLVPGLFYVASNAKLFGAPGGTKSFFVLDLALCLATGTPWRGLRLPRVRVHYVMAEGQQVNQLRTRAWLLHHGIAASLLDGWFFAFPQGVLLTEPGMAGYIEEVEADQPGLAIFDTKNRMYVGNENDGSDVAVMLRAMDSVRTVSPRTCTALIDHSGLGDPTRSRGSNASEGGMDTEVRVSFADGIGTAEITRDKAGPIGTTWRYRLQRVDEVSRPEGVAAPAVCVPTEDTTASAGTTVDAEWWDWLAQPELPADVTAITGKGAQVVPHLAAYVRWTGQGLTDAAGVTRAEAVKVVSQLRNPTTGKPIASAKTIERAWDLLREAGRIEPASDSRSHVGRHVWVAKPTDTEAGS